MADGEDRNSRNEVGNLNLVCCIFCIGYEANEYARDADDPARSTKAGEILQCGFLSYAAITSPGGTARWPP